jgi:hypothetical protein
MNARKIFSVHFLQFVCSSIREGWFGAEMTQIVTEVLSVCEGCSRGLPDALASFLIDAFSIVTDHHLPFFLELFVTYGRVIFGVEKV